MSFFASFRKFQWFHCLPTRSKSRDVPWLGSFVSTNIPVSVWQSADVRKNKTAQSRHVTGFAARRQTMEPLEFSKTSKKRRLKRQIFCFCAVTVVSSTVFEREISCQHVDVNMRMPQLFSVAKSSDIPRWGQSVSDRNCHTCLFFIYVWYSTTIGRWTAQVTSMRGTCDFTKVPKGQEKCVGILIRPMLIYNYQYVSNI